jgi:hypothetical protein
VRVRPLALATAALTLSASCSPPPFDATRVVPERGTLGEEIFRLFHRDYEREDPRKAEGLALAKPELVGTIDHLFTADELQAVQAFLVRLLPLYDDATVPSLTRHLSAVAARLTDDPETVASLTTLLNRSGYVSVPHQEALARRIAAYPRYRELTKELLALALAHDGRDATGAPDPTEDDSLERLLASLTEGLATVELSDDAERTINLVADLLATEDARLAGGVPLAPGGNSSIAARDSRGMAMVAALGGGVPPPFVDVAPADGLADIDGDGRFVDASGKPIDLAPFGTGGVRDANSRALAAPGGDPLYRFVELDRTLLGGLMRDTRTMIARDVPTKGLDLFELFLGTRAADGHYVTANNKLLDLAYAGAVAVDGRDLPDTLDVLRKLLVEQEELLGYLLEQTQRQLDIADAHPVALAPGNTLFNDLLRVIRKILEAPGLAESLLTALEDPAVLGLPQAAVRLMEFKHPRIGEADFQAGRVFVTRVDRSRPDVADNQSLQQRMWHLIHDTRKARYEPSLVGVPLGFIFEIPDQAEFYMLSIIGRAEIPPLVSRLTGLSERPTPEELAVFLNAEQTFGNPQGNEGIDVRDNDGDTLFAVSASGMKDALRPLVQVFYDRGQLDLLFELFEVLYLHWPSVEGGVYQSTSRSQPKYAQNSGVARYEPMLISQFRETFLVAGLHQLLRNTRALTATSGKPARDVLLALGRKLLLKDAALKTREGRGEVVVEGERISPLSPLDLLRGARADVHAVIRRSNRTQADWDLIVDTLHDLFLKTRSTGPQAARFDNSRMIPVVTEVLRFAHQRALERQRTRTLDGWLRRELLGHLDDAVVSDELPALLDLLHVVRDDPELSDMLVELRDQLMAEDQGFPELLAVLGDTLQSAKDARLAVPALRFVGRELAPDKDLMFEAASMMRRSLDADPDERMLEIVRRGLETRPQGGLYLSGLGRAIKQTHRLNPLDTGPLSAEDTRRIVAAVARYLVDGEHGLEKFYELVARRDGTP